MKFLKGAVIFVLGAGVGTSVSYIIFKKKYEEKKSELDEVKEHYMEKITTDHDKTEYETIVNENRYVPYNKEFDAEVKKIIERVELNEVGKDSPPEDYPEEPIIISESDYIERELYFDKIEVDYYLEDGALVGENEELMEPNDTVGYNNLEDFIRDDREDVMYVRNASANADYLVRKLSGSYSNIIGIGGDDDD